MQVFRVRERLDDELAIFRLIIPPAGKLYIDFLGIILICEQTKDYIFIEVLEPLMHLKQVSPVTE